MSADRPQVVEVHLDESSIGSGYRVVVAQVGRKWAKLTSPATLDTARIPVEQFRRAVRRSIEPSRTLRIMRQAVKQHKRLGMAYAEVHVRELLAEFRGEP